jgi:hypothetical protein
MSRKIFTLFISLLVTAALAALAQSPTSSAPPGSSSTQDPYGATMDHPNPTGNNSTAPITDSRSATQGNSTTTTMTTAPAAAAPAATPTDSSTSTSTSMSTIPVTDSTSNNAATTTATAPVTTDTSTSTDVNTPTTLPRTASELPLLAVLGLLALGGAVTTRTFAKRSS